MKKIFAIAFAACTLAACSDTKTEETTDVDTMTTTTVEPATTTTTTTVTHTPGDGDITYNGGKVQVYRNNTWEDANDDVKMDNGVVIYRDGRAMRDGNEVMLEDGYTVDRDGNVWDRTGNAISDAWDATKHG